MWERQFRCSFACLLLAAFAGCSQWSSTSSDYSLFDPPRMSPDSVVIEMAILDLRSENVDAVERLWGEVDELQVEPDARRQLAAHGLRSGVIGVHVPEWIVCRLSQQCKHLQLDSNNGMAMPSDIKVQRRLQCRAGKRRELPIGARFEKLTVMGDSDLPTEYSDGQCLLMLTASPLGDGRVSLELVPEIHYGEPKQRWVGQGGEFRADIALDSVSFDGMKVTATLNPGETMLLAATPEADRLGRAVCQSETAETPAKRLVLLRLAQTQSDDLFAPHQSLTPIATLME